MPTPSSASSRAPTTTSPSRSASTCCSPACAILVEKGGKKKIRLTDKEASILKYLFRAGDRPVARDVLLNEVWGYNAGVTTHTLETHIYRLRQKIEKDPTNAAILITDRGGYRLQP